MDILLGNDVASIQYDQSQLRVHLVSCLKIKSFTAFPRKRYRQEADKSIFVDGDWKSQSKSPKRKMVQESTLVSTSNSFEILSELAEEGCVAVSSSKDDGEKLGGESKEESKKKVWTPGDLVLNLKRKDAGVRFKILPNPENDRLI